MINPSSKLTMAVTLQYFDIDCEALSCIKYRSGFGDPGSIFSYFNKSSFCCDEIVAVSGCSPYLLGNFRCNSYE